MTEHIRILDVAPRRQYMANGSQSAFTYDFAIFVEGDLQVYLGSALQASGYTVSGAGISTGGTVVFAVPPADGVVVTLLRRLAVQRATDYQADGVIRAKVINAEFDYQTAAIQQVAEDAGRALKRAPTSASAADLTLPEPVAGRAIKWNAGADGLENSGVDVDVTATAAAASAAAAAAALASATASAAAAAASQAAAAVSAAAAQGATPGALKVTDADTTLGKLDGKLGVAGLLTKAVTDPGGDEVLTLAVAVASQAEAEAGTAADKAMTPERTAQAIAALATSAATTARLDSAEGNLGLLFLGLARLTASTAPEQGGAEVPDEFDDATGVGSLGGATVTGGTLANSGVFSQVAQATGSTLGDMTNGGGLAAAFDGNASQVNAATCFKQSAQIGYVGKDWGAGVANAITKTIVYPESASRFGLDNATNASTVTVTVQGSTDNFASSIVDLGSASAAQNGGAITVLTPAAAAYRYVRAKVDISAAGNSSVCTSEVQFFMTTAPADIVAVSIAYTAVAVASAVTLVAEYQAIDGSTVNTDITFEVSRDNGTTWTAVTMTDFGPAQIAGARVLKGAASIVTQPGGTAMKWRIMTHNSKEQRVHGIWMQWR